MDLKRSQRIADRLIEVSQDGQISYSDELGITEYLFNRLNLKLIAEAAKEKGISYNGMKQRVSSGKEMALTVGKHTFVSV